MYCILLFTLVEASEYFASLKLARQYCPYCKRTVQVVSVLNQIKRQLVCSLTLETKFIVLLTFCTLFYFICCIFGISLNVSIVNSCAVSKRCILRAS